MLCQILSVLPHNFLVIWLSMTAAAMVVVFAMTSLAFHWLYVKASFPKWQYKSNGTYPPVSMVREEVIKTAKALAMTTLLPTAAIYFRDEPWSKGYCPQDANFEELSGQALPVLAQFAAIVLVTDFVEFFYHWCGHYFNAGWNLHRHHHRYYNPTPFAVIADEAWDNLVRASPLFWLPLIFNLHMEVLWYTFLIFFYCYGIYLHSGYEADWIISATNPIVNTSFQHYIHHAAGTRKRPCNCGFFIKIWDQIWGTCYDGPECHASAEREKGNRSIEKWEEVAREFPNYSLLWTSWSFWMDPEGHERKGHSVTKNILQVVSNVKLA